MGDIGRVFADSESRGHGVEGGLHGGVDMEDDLTTLKDGKVALSLDLMWVKSEGMEGMMNDGAKARSFDLKVE